MIQLKEELHSLRMQGDNLTNYLNKAKGIHDQLEASGCHIDDEDMLIYIMNGLPASFNSFKTAFRLRTEYVDLPTFSSLLSNEDLNIKRQSTIPTPDPHHALATTYHQPPPTPTRNPNYKGKNPRPYYPKSPATFTANHLPPQPVIPPEWIAGLPITPKVDVYSYGMMIFEVVSGKRNNMHSGDGSLAFYPSWAVRRVLEGEVKCLLDERLEGVDEEQLMRVCRVACWCIQDLEDLRPGMRQVVQILEGALEVNLPPMPLALQNMMYSSQDCDVYSLKKEEKGERREEIIGESHLDDNGQASTLSR